MTLSDVINNLPEFKGEEIIKSFVKGYSIINNPRYKNIMCSISGGADSDIMLDLIHRIDANRKVIYVWFDTGVEYQASKEHLVYLEKRYNIKIHREKAIKPIPVCTREYGQPFISKMVSEALGALQRYNFKFEDKSYDELILEYPKIQGYIAWWCNKSKVPNGIYTVGHNKYLKEFLIQNPPYFKISNKCCTYSKKNVSKNYIKNHNIDLVIMGIRRAEGGIRAARYKNCYTSDGDNYDSYRPLFWFKNEDKEEYENAFNIKHSDCYTKYGFKRTGCVGCPYSHDLDKVLSQLEIHEPKLYKAANNIFKESYEYTKQYRQFVKEMKEKESKYRRTKLW